MAALGMQIMVMLIKWWIPENLHDDDEHDDHPKDKDEEIKELL
jgi:hypothetical protein